MLYICKVKVNVITNVIKIFKMATLTKTAIDYAALRGWLSALKVGEAKRVPITGVRPSAVYTAISRAKRCLGYEVKTTTDDALRITVKRIA